MITTVAVEVPDRIEFDTCTYVLDMVSDSGHVRLYRAEDDPTLCVVEVDDTTPERERASVWIRWQPVAADAMMDEVVEGIRGETALRVMVRAR